MLSESETNVAWKCSKVMCLTTMEIFDSINQAEKNTIKVKVEKDISEKHAKIIVGHLSLKENHYSGSSITHV